MAVSEQITIPRIEPRYGAAARRRRAIAGRLPFPVFLFLLLVLLPVEFELGSLAMSGLRLYLLLLAVPLTIGLFTEQYGPILPIDVLFFLHVGWMIVAIGVNNPSQVVQYVGSNAIEFLGAYLLARACIRSVPDFVALCRWLAYLLCLTLSFAVYEAIVGEAPIMAFIDNLPGVSSLSKYDMDRRLGLSRVQMVFDHPILYGIFATLGISLTFVGLKDVVANSRRYLLTLGVILCVFFSLSSGAYLAAMLQFGLLIWGQIFRDRRPWRLLIIVVVLSYAAIDLGSNRTPMRVFMSYATFNPQTAFFRSVAYDFGIQNVLSNPVFGLGLRDWVRPSWMVAASVDNFWLLTAMRYGIPGFALLAGGYLLALVLIGRKDFSGDARLSRLRLAWMLTFVGLAFSLVTVHVWSSVYSFVFFLFGAGMWFLNTPDVPAPEEEVAPEDEDRRRPPQGGSPHDRQRAGPEAPQRLYSRFPVRPRDRAP
ncbi:O-antigen ligase family protein [Actibacterium sp. D379-3]